MAQNWIVKKQVEEFVDMVAASPVKQFYPTAVPKYSRDLSLDDAFDYLIELCRTGEIHLLWEIKCPGEDDINLCLKTLDKVPNYKTLLKKDYLCDLCGSDVTVSDENVFPVFEIDEDYKSYMREELKKKNENRLRLKIKSEK